MSAFDEKPAHEKKIIYFMIFSLLLLIVSCEFAKEYDNLYLLGFGIFCGGMLLGATFVERVYRNLKSPNPAGNNDSIKDCDR